MSTTPSTSPSPSTIEIDSSFGIKAVSLPYDTIEEATTSIKEIHESNGIMKLECHNTKETSNNFFIYIVNEKQAKLGVFKDSEFLMKVFVGSKADPSVRIEKSLFIQLAETEEDRKQAHANANAV